MGLYFPLRETPRPFPEEKSSTFIVSRFFFLPSAGKKHSSHALPSRRKRAHSILVSVYAYMVVCAASTERRGRLSVSSNSTRKRPMSAPCQLGAETCTTAKRQETKTDNYTSRKENTSESGAEKNSGAGPLPQQRFFHCIPLSVLVLYSFVKTQARI